MIGHDITNNTLPLLIKDDDIQDHFLDEADKSNEVQFDMETNETQERIRYKNLLDGNHPILKDETILNFCKNDGSLVVGSDFAIYTTSVINSNIEGLISLIKAYQETQSNDIKEVFVRLATQEAINKVLKIPNKLLLARSDTDNQLTTESNKLAGEELHALLNQVRAHNAADVHLKIKTGESTIVRIRTEVGVVLLNPVTKDADYGMRIGGYIFGPKASSSSNGAFMPAEANESVFSWTINGRECRFRASTMPLYNGCKIVIRSLEPASNNILTLKEAGFLSQQIKMLLNVIEQPNGSLLIVGQTGSGKTTTLMALMNLIKDNRSIHTIEDPVELTLDKLAQTEVSMTGEKDASGITIGSFADFAKRLLRQDIDVGVIGEIRDVPTAASVYRLATTGHFIMGTLHTSSTVGVPNVLVEFFGLSPIQVADKDAFTAFVYQTLANKPCSHCCLTHEQIKEKYHKKHIHQSTYDERGWFSHQKRMNELDIAESLFKDELDNLKYKNDAGCDSCKYTGVKGKTVLAEILMLDSKLRGFIERREISQMINYLESINFPTVKDHAIYCVRNGIIDLHEAFEKVGDLSEKSNQAYSYDELNKHLLATYNKNE